jgi:KaiC/GvpD/RAD55 family RecA-like ATPase
MSGAKHTAEYYIVQGEVGKFLQRVEKKPVESVVITMDGEQGAGKTTTLYKFIDSFAAPGNKCLFYSLEEHPTSQLAQDKVKKYISIEAIPNVDIIGDVDSVQQFYEDVANYDVVFIDSWQKLQRMIGNIKLDEEIRKKFDGKVFVVIFQQTTTGRTKGGSEVVFDGDIIIKMVKEGSFSENYAFFDKNRYTLIPIENIRYNIADGKCYNPNQEAEPETIDIEHEEVENNGLMFNFVN